MTDRPHIFEIRRPDFLKLMIGSFLFGLILALIFYFGFGPSEGHLTWTIIGLATGMIAGANIFSYDYRGTYILGAIIGTVASGVLLYMNFEDPFFVGFAPFGGVFGALIMVLPEHDW